MAWRDARRTNGTRTRTRVQRDENHRTHLGEGDNRRRDRDRSIVAELALTALRVASEIINYNAARSDERGPSRRKVQGKPHSPNGEDANLFVNRVYAASRLVSSRLDFTLDICGKRRKGESQSQVSSR